MRNVSFLAVAVVFAAATAACGPAPTIPAPKIEETTFAAALKVDLEASTRLSTGEYVRDLEVGDGDEVMRGKLISVVYTGNLANGTQFDSNDNATAAPFSFRYGAGEVIKGWDQGFDGMKVGGVRQLIIPPSLGYGVSGVPPRIPSNAILVFMVRLKDA